jgi:hypothetical protein
MLCGGIGFHTSDFTYQKYKLVTQASRAVFLNLRQGKFRTGMVILLTAALHYYETCDSSCSNEWGKHQDFA